MSFNSACDALLLSSADWNRQPSKLRASSGNIPKSQEVKAGDGVRSLRTSRDFLVFIDFPAVPETSMPLKACICDDISLLCIRFNVSSVFVALYKI
ncbi:hypothetical protein TNCV_451781 [Trichonephila clavipes]|nr:hypothetical protein TNCV_451781 [Trichonephila clavipes]